jgi:hypothetical protein
MAQVSPYRDPRDAEIEMLREKVADYEKRLGIVPEEVRALAPIAVSALPKSIEDMVKAKQKSFDDKNKRLAEQKKNEKRVVKLRIKKLKKSVMPHLKRLRAKLRLVQGALDKEDLVYLYSPAGLAEDKGNRDLELWRNHGVILHRGWLMIGGCGYIGAQWGDGWCNGLLEYMAKRNVDPVEFFQTIDKNVADIFKEE